MNYFFNIKVYRVSIYHFLKKWAFISFLFGFFCLQATDRAKERDVTIFVHGITSIKPHLSLTNFFRFLNGNIQNTTYCETAKLMRNDQFFFMNQAMLAQGLHKIDNTHAHLIGAPLLVHLMDSIKPHANDTDYYTFGWSGLMSFSERQKAAAQLQKALVQLQQEYEKEDITPTISVIGYSHGATVTLNLGLVPKHERLKPIKEVILLGMPIPAECHDCLAQVPAQDIYHIYSRLDRIQAHDIFSSGRLLNKQYITKNKKKPIPDNVHQIELRIMRPRKGSRKSKHAATGDFSKRRILLGNSKSLRCASPGHFELWFFGWPSTSYTRPSGLFPLPIVTFVPYILNQIQRYRTMHQPHEPLIVDLRPEHCKMIIRNKFRKNLIYTTDFLDAHTVQQLHTIAWSKAPEDYTAKAVKTRMKLNYNAGQKIHLQSKKPRTLHVPAKKRRVKTVAA